MKHEFVFYIYVIIIIIYYKNCITDYVFANKK